MNQRFQEIVRECQQRTSELMGMPSRPWGEFSSLPKSGMYVFYEGETPVYVGRSNRLKGRLAEHARPSSTHYSAPFAFNLAKEAAANRGMPTEGKGRSDLERVPESSRLFGAAKERVRKMRYRAVAVENQLVQTLLEVYIHLELGTKHNDFSTH